MREEARWSYDAGKAEVLRVSLRNILQGILKSL